ncbi:MAG: hypothetical protein A2Y77_11035 [Planctomycetes bacterium RBG_13_62_9]|nr:MAG: hypothetical protein A2Y77_11035 [Planctomycetes bacterium RBG_13_62_9]
MNRATADKDESIGGRFLLWGSLAVLVGLALWRDTRGAAEQGQAAAAPPNEIVATLKEVPVWELASEQVRSSFLRGNYTALRNERFPNTKYPEFASGTPLYGEVQFNDGGKRHSFSLALDCSQQGANYNLLYFDDNRDADLTNDKPRKPSKEASDSLARPSSSLKETFFESVTVPFDFGPGGEQSLELLPCLRTYEGSQPQLSFIAARVHVGEFEIDGTSHQAFIGYQYTIRGRLDQPSTTLMLAPRRGEPAYWWGGNQLNATHLLGDRYYRFSCTPMGDKLTVRPYDGPLGVFEVGAGGRKVERLAMRGSLRSQESAVAVGDGLDNGWPKATRQCQIPVGDYYPAIIDIDIGDVRLTVSNNYHTNAQGQPSGREPVSGITIRQDKPYVLDFSNKPVVIFEQPKANARVRLGSEVKVEAVLVDPVLDIMIRGLNQMGRTKTRTIKTGDGREQVIGEPWSLDPNVVIKRAGGEIVAEGVMPFG